MFTEEMLRAEHEALAALAAQLLDAAASAPLDVERIGRTRWQMTRVLTQHLAKEDKLLYPRLMQSQDREIATIAMRFNREMGGLAEAYRAYMAAWNPDRMKRDPATFAMETRVVMSALDERIRRENGELYPMLPREGATG